ncbi:hypothetical protein N7490_001982 [Penicillium lividum]|nr:hypothetical protein N7490_001982 [Penicillium lividum]
MSIKPGCVHLATMVALRIFAMGFFVAYSVAYTLFCLPGFIMSRPLRSSAFVSKESTTDLRSILIRAQAMEEFIDTIGAS